MRFIKLNAIEEAELERLYETSSNAAIRKHSQCLLLSDKGIEIIELMKIFSVSRLTIYNWFDKWESTNFLSLKHQEGQGRKLKLQDIPAYELSTILAKHPQNIHLVLLDLQTQFAVKCHKITLLRHLKKMKIAI